MRSVKGVDQATIRSRVTHPDVVEVGEQHREPHDEVPAVDGSRRDETAVDGPGQDDDARRDVARMDDPVIGEQRRVEPGRRGQ